MVDKSMHTIEEMRSTDKKIKVTVSLGKPAIDILCKLEHQENRTTSNAIETIILCWNHVKTIMDNDPEMKKQIEQMLKDITF